MTAGAAGQSVADALPAIAAQQVVAAVVPLHCGPDGSYRVSLRLHPEELGNVAVTVEVSKGTVSLHMRAEAPATTSVLGDAMPQLRAQLEAQGLQTGSLVVADYSGGSAGGWAGREHPLTGQWATPAGTPGFSEPDPAPTAHDTPTPQRRDGGLDLHL
jgi:flagellar hook-length control protein FliK